MTPLAYVIAILSAGALLWAGPLNSAPAVADRQATQAQAVTLDTQAAEAFLEAARIVRVEPLGQGVTHPFRVTLEHDGLTHDAVFKSIDQQRREPVPLRDGTTDMEFWDSWQCEVAAYRVARLIGLTMVPVTVERSVDGHKGSLQWWVDDVKMSEADRMEHNVRAPDQEAWDRQSFEVWLFDELIANVDRHMNNLLIAGDFRIQLIDHSRSFRRNRRLRAPDRLTRFSGPILDRLQQLTFEQLKAETGRYLQNTRIQRLLDRRDAIVELARQRVAQHGEAAVIYR